MSKEEILPVVNKKNIFIKRAKRSVIHKKGLFHQAVNILVVNSQKEIFLQQRSRKKSICPLLWDISASEHLKVGETYHQACLRGLKEELKIITRIKIIRNTHLQKNTYFHNKIQDYEYVKLFAALYDKEIFINKEEVETGKFFTVENLEKKLKTDRKSFTPWFLEEWEYFKKVSNINLIISSLLKH